MVGLEETLRLLRYHYSTPTERQTLRTSASTRLINTSPTVGVSRSMSLVVSSDKHKVGIGKVLPSVLDDTFLQGTGVLYRESI